MEAAGVLAEMRGRISSGEGLAEGIPGKRAYWRAWQTGETVRQTGIPGDRDQENRRRSLKKAGRQTDKQVRQGGK